MVKDIDALIRKHGKALLGQENVAGWSAALTKKIKDGKPTDVIAFRVYVKEKKPVSALRDQDVIPRFIEGIPTDVIEIGEVKALEVDKTKKFRPVQIGVSVGHISITAGSLGELYSDGEGNLLAGSNAHVLCSNPSFKPEEVSDKRILQPGSYHGGVAPDDVAGEYVWHKTIVPVGVAECQIGNGLCKVATWINKNILRNQGEIRYYAITPNKIDFAVYRPTVEHTGKTADDSLTDEPFIGHLFAGSDTVGIICKVNNIIVEGYKPLRKTASVAPGDTVKGCSFWCNTEQIVIDSSAAVNVGYDNFTAFFSDVILINNKGAVIRGGWSGSAFRKVN